MTGEKSNEVSVSPNWLQLFGIIVAVLNVSSDMRYYSEEMAQNTPLCDTICRF